MSDDLDDLRARVAAARDRLAHDVAFAQKVELRLNDLARIVEGSLARQATELDGAKGRIGELETDLERALARAEQAAGEAARAEKLGKENGDLRSMVMTLLEVIEGRQKSSLTSVMQKLEENVSSLVAAPAQPLPAEPPLAAIEPSGAEPEAMLATAVEEPLAQQPAAGGEAEPGDLGPAPAADMELETEPQVPAEDDIIDAALDEAARAGSPPLEDLSEIALYDAADEVVEPERP
ncbi:hypothetical protein [Dongia sp.]|uniref:hypothetical protein n=1 Tax=Dongia sp. TaxID=1977262 RepID=UPI0035B3F631